MGSDPQAITDEQLIEGAKVMPIVALASVKTIRRSADRLEAAALAALGVEPRPEVDVPSAEALGIDLPPEPTVPSAETLDAAASVLDWWRVAYPNMPPNTGEARAFLRAIADRQRARERRGGGGGE